MSAQGIKRIGLMGGSFDPVHCGHMAMANEALRLLSLDRLWFIPARTSPFKMDGATASSEDRLAMLRLATRGEPRFGVSDCELLRGGVSYTIDTIRLWRARFPSAELFFIAGMDSLLSLRLWKDAEEIVSLCRFTTFLRPGSIVAPSRKDIGMSEAACSKLLAGIVRAKPHNVSATMVRERIEKGLDVSHLLPPSVSGYITARGLYGRRRQ